MDGSHGINPSHGVDHDHDRNAVGTRKAAADQMPAVLPIRNPRDAIRSGSPVDIFMQEMHGHGVLTSQMRVDVTD